jgi:Flp pilus assembly pilin Flp
VTMRREEDTVNTPPVAPPGRVPLDGEDGQVLAEYALILVFVSIVALALTPLGPTLAGVFSNLAAAL